MADFGPGNPGSSSPESPGQGSHAPAVNVQATITIAAPGTGLRLACNSITAMLVANTTAPAAAKVSVRLIDGASGGATILWEAVLALQAVAGDRAGIALAPLFIRGSANTAMTLEFDAAGGANTFESVAITTEQVGA